VKLFLTSLWLLPAFCEPFAELVGKPLDQIRVALIENGADDEPGEEPKWVKKARASLTDVGVTVTQVDLRKYTGRNNNHDELKALLADHDVIWVGGGNTFYLNWILRDSGAAEIITELVNNGKVYAGGSAGSIVAGPTVRGFEDADDASFAPELVPDGMHFTDIVVVPHWGRSDYGAVMQNINDQLVSKGYKTQPLTDREVLLIDGAELRVIA
jgi:dipeptidase E